MGGGGVERAPQSTQSRVCKAHMELRALQMALGPEALRQEGLRLEGCRWETTRCGGKTIWLPSEPRPVLGLPCALSQPAVLQSD